MPGPNCVSWFHNHEEDWTGPHCSQGLQGLQPLPMATSGAAQCLAQPLSLPFVPRALTTATKAGVFVVSIQTVENTRASG